MKKLLGLMLVMLIFGCSSKPVQVKVKALHDMKVESMSTAGQIEHRDVKAGEFIEVNGQYNKFESQGKIPLMMIGPVREETMSKNDKESGWTLNLKDIEVWKPQATDEFINKNVDQLFYNLIDVLTLTKTKKNQEALQLIRSMLEKYPKLSSLYFIKAQLEIIENNYSFALKSIDACLEVNPNFAEAKKLREKILQRGKP